MTPNVSPISWPKSLSSPMKWHQMEILLSGGLSPREVGMKGHVASILPKARYGPTSSTKRPAVATARHPLRGKSTARSWPAFA